MQGTSGFLGKESMKASKISSFFLLAVTGLTLSSCAFVSSMETFVDVEVVADGNVVSQGKISQFNNLLLPNAPEKAGFKFFRWYAGDVDSLDKQNADKDPRAYKEGGLIRLDNVRPYVINNKLTVNGVYLTPEEIPHAYIVVGWYDKTSTSGLDQSDVDRWAPHAEEFVKNWCLDQGQSEEDAVKHSKDIDIRAYSNNGNVAALGAGVNKDGDVDILLGVGNNVDSSSGSNIAIEEKQGDIPMNGKTRYIARLTDKPEVNALYNWLKTSEGYGPLSK